MESKVMNWGKIVIYASLLFFAQMVIGITEGFFSPGASSSDPTEISYWRILSYLTSVIVCTFIFAHMAAHQTVRPFAHACLSLVFYGAASLGVSVAFNVWFGYVPTSRVFLEWLGLVVALSAGVVVGRAIGRKRDGLTPVSRNA
jgi:hypothetical protein